MHIRLTRLLKIGSSNIEYDLKEKLYKKYTGVDYGDDSKIKDVMAVDNNKNNDEKNP